MEYEWLINGSFTMGYQPLWQLKTGDTSKAESLYDIIPSTRDGLRLRSQCCCLISKGRFYDSKPSITFIGDNIDFISFAGTLVITGLLLFLAWIRSSLRSYGFWTGRQTNLEPRPPHPEGRKAATWATLWQKSVEWFANVCNGMGKSGRPHSFADISSFPCFTLL